MQLVAKAEDAIRVTDDELARKIEGREKREAAKKLAKDAEFHHESPRTSRATAAS